MLTSEESHQLINAALAVRQRAFAPYSNFLVGAAILDTLGNLHLGCNVENASFGLTMCAERVAIGSAISAGQRNWKAIAIASVGAVTPCGACRQVLHEFSSNLVVLLVDAETREISKRWTTGELLPGAFGLNR